MKPIQFLFPCAVLMFACDALFPTAAVAAYADVRDQILTEVEAQWLADGARYNSVTTAITTELDALGAVDGDKTEDYGFHVASDEMDPWWQVDLGSVHRLDRIVVYNRTDGGMANRTRNINVLVAVEALGRAANEAFDTVYKHPGPTFYGAKEKRPLVVEFDEKPVDARIIRLMVPGRCSFALVEVEVYAAAAPDVNIALGKSADQKSVGPWSKPPAANAILAEEKQFSLEHVADTLQRAVKLAQRLRITTVSGQISVLNDRLDAMRALENMPSLGDRRELYLNARRLLREIAFSNPLLQDIERLLFIKRHDAAGEFHMCDQYYGFNAVPGGGVYVLDNPFGESPTLRNLLADSVVTSGRLAGQKLEGGSFLSPDVSYDGKTVYFAYSEAKGTPGRPDLGTPAPEEAWTPEASYHIFRVNADGTGLEQLTDGSENDFDPCVLPGGRIAFISERRGGFLRCGRHCPTYTLFSMEPDGSDIICLSYHETHEWNPSVNNDGMIVYTRWDYVDRDSDIAHHKWFCFPDGRDPRTNHGNYPHPHRQSRPWIEMRIRSIPGSHRYIGVAAAHHGHEFGSLILIDPHIVDDGALSQLTRLTPEVPFPESEARPIRPAMVYGTPWPLSEQDYICVYDAEAGNRGIFWVDSDGNRELIYRDPEIPCVSPRPFQPRPMPPVIPNATTQTLAARKAAGGQDRPATIGVMNVYETIMDWPEGTEITDLRVIHLLPKTTPAPNDPRIGVAEQSNARAILGTVPVEKDGSAYFEAPVGKSIYFQALNRQGMAVQSMRSITYVHPGERLTCIGCHEDKHAAPPKFTEIPTAFRRDPSPISPEPEGSNPFSYVRLVQPVLDNHCVKCHNGENGSLDLCGHIEDNGFARSYNQLAKDYGFYYDVWNGSFEVNGARSYPGKVGAKASKLMARLDASLCGEGLSDEDRRRIIVWLDANTEFYGAYENILAQQRGEIVHPALE